jgi:hypothetical protein
LIAVTCNASDAAGNASTPTTFIVHVVYNFVGLLPPYSVDKGYMIKSAIPLKWQSADAAGFKNFCTVWARRKVLSGKNKMFENCYMTRKEPSRAR